MTGWDYDLVGLPDGRQLEVLVHGNGPRGFVWLTGTPGGAVPDDDLARDVQQHGLRLIQPLRPGYGRSSPHPGRRVVDLVPDVDAALQHLGVHEVVVMGGSGGGPHALAMAARLPQCKAAGVVVSPAPRDADGLDFYDGMAWSNQEEWRLADQGEEAVRPFLEKAAPELRQSEGKESYLDAFGDNLCTRDLEVLASSGWARFRASMQKALENGIEGWLEDDLALVTPWGFALDDISTPVTFWAGKQDQFLSYQHSAWLGQRVPCADVHLYGEEGHLSLRLRHMATMALDVVTRAGW